MDTGMADIGATEAITDTVATMAMAAITVTVGMATDTEAVTAAGAATARMAARFTNGEADSEAVMVPTATPEPVSMAAQVVASTVQVVAGFTVVVEGMEADTGN
jgi:hypothetical protein